MADWLIWIAVLFVSAVLIELLRLSWILFKAMERDWTIAGCRPENPSSEVHVSVIVPAKDE